MSTNKWPRRTNGRVRLCVQIEFDTWRKRMCHISPWPSVWSPVTADEKCWLRTGRRHRRRNPLHHRHARLCKPEHCLRMRLPQHRPALSVAETNFNFIIIIINIIIITLVSKIGWKHQRKRWCRRTHLSPPDLSYSRFGKSLNTFLISKSDQSAAWTSSQSSPSF